MKKLKLLVMIVVFSILSSTSCLATTSTHTRQATGVNGTLSFQAGDTVYGTTIIINGTTYCNGYIVNVSATGTVTNGVINPWATEIANATELKETTTEWRLCYEAYFWPELGHKEYFGEYVNGVYTGNFYYIGYITLPGESLTVTPSPCPNKTRVTTGTGKTLTFTQGDTVVGYKIVLNGKTYKNDGIGVVLYNAPTSGTVTNGVINPWPSEITNQKLITPNQINIPHCPQYTRIVITNNTTSFQKGVSVYGQIIIIDNIVYKNKYIINAPAGTVTNGIIWPNKSDIPYNTETIFFQ